MLIIPFRLLYKRTYSPLYLVEKKKKSRLYLGIWHKETKNGV